MSGKIIAIGTAVPKYSASQSDILEFMKRAYNNEQDSRKLKALFHFSGIETRYSSLPDFGMLPEAGFFKATEKQPHVEDRMDVFKENALHLAESAVESAMDATSLNASQITHLITVSCTGMYAPGLSAEIIHHLKLRDDIFHTSVNFLGCNAAFHALKIADLIVQSNHNARVLIVTVELCTLHFQPKNNTDNLLSNTIFGDGSAALLMTSNDYQGPGFTVHGFYSLLLQRGEHLMGWDVNPQSFEMILNAQVPQFIGEEIDDIVARTASYFEINQNDVTHWAIHPGGKKILDEIRKQLNLKYDDLAHSYEVLKNYGNMSSPTVLFVLKRLMETAPKGGNNILAIGFGPGLSIDTSLLSYVE